MSLVLGRFGDESFFCVSASYDAARGALPIGRAQTPRESSRCQLQRRSLLPLLVDFVRMPDRSTSLHRKRNYALTYEIIYDAIDKFIENINLQEI